MKVSIVCPGPSSRSYRRSNEGHVYAINRAATFFECDTWACGDSPLIQQEHAKVIGTPRLLTAYNSADTLKDRGWTWKGRCITTWHPKDHREIPEWNTFTLTAALVIARDEGAKRIEVFGADWTGTIDADGIEAGKNRTDARWRLERTIFERIAVELSRQGITVLRHAT